MRALQAMAAALCLLLLPCAARADDATPRRSTLYVGPKVAFFGSSGLVIDGETQKSESDFTDYALSAGYRYRLLPWLGAELSGSIGKYSTSWSRERDESRARADIALGPVLLGTLYRARAAKARLSRADWRLGIPVGVTWAWFEAGASRAVQARYEGGRGFTFGAVAGVDFSFAGNHGAYVDVGLAMSSLSITRSATVSAAPSVGGDEAYRYSDVRLWLAWGYALHF